MVCQLLHRQVGIIWNNTGTVQDAELDSVITRSASLLKGLPRRWLSEIMERLDSAFDVTLTAQSLGAWLACMHLPFHSHASVSIFFLFVLSSLKQQASLRAPCRLNMARSRSMAVRMLLA